jgi:hypothetical protein
MPLTLGNRIGSYEVVALIGEGGMGQVYRARDTKLNRDVALKVLPPLVANDPDRLARFRREAQVLASLNDPHIAQIYGFEDSGEAHALVMELVDGPTLEARIAQGPLPLTDALAIARQIAAALEAAHERGIVHRDLKPANVKVRADGAVKVLDFGLAKAFGPEAPNATADAANSPTITTPAMTAMGMILGTAAYMAPEQARGQTIDKRADIWAFGVVLYEMLTGARLFTAATVSYTLAAVLRQEIDWTTLPADTSATVRELLRRCLDRDPKQRLRDIGEARIRLSESDNDARESTASAAALPLPRRRRWLGVVAALVLAVAVGAGVWWGKPSVTIPVRRLELPSDVAAHGVRGAFNAAGAALAPDGASVAYLSAGHLYVQPLDAMSPRDLGRVPVDAAHLFWSPDSQSIGLTGDGAIRRVPAGGGTSFVICRIPGTGRMLDAAWLPTGTIVFSVWRGDVYDVPAGGGTPAVRLAFDPATEIDFHEISVLPRGRLLVVVHRIGHDVQVPELVDGRTRTPIAADAGVEDIRYASGFLLFRRTGLNSGLWAAPFAGGPIDLTTAVSVQPGAGNYDVANDGTLLVGRPVARRSSFVWVDRAGRPTPIAGAPVVALAAGQPLALSPDGHRVAFFAETDGADNLIVRDLDTGLDRPLTSNREGDDVVESGFPAWNPSGDRVIYTSGAVGAIKILERRADGSTGAREILSARQATFSRDGHTLLCIVDDAGRGRLRYAPLSSDGRPGPLQPVFRSDEPDVLFADLSPDGSSLAMAARDPNGQLNIVLTPFPSGSPRWAVTTDGGNFPKFSADGRELFYAAGTRAGDGSTSGRLMRVPIALHPSITIGVPTALFGNTSGLALAGFSVSPDGQRFLMSTPAPAAPGEGPRVVLVQNWVAGLPK